MDEVKIGSIVKADYNSGMYIGKIIEDRGNFTLVKVLAVLKHPTQGDLHNPGKVEQVAFFERKALGFQEKMNARKRKIYPFQGEIPNYGESLKEAVKKLKEELISENTAFNQKSLEKLDILEKHYYKKVDY